MYIQNTEYDLQPCPFCGSTEEPTVWANDPLDGMKGMIHQISCSCCGCDGPPASSKLHAVRLWNARPAADGTPPLYIRKLAAKAKKRTEKK